MKSMLLLLVTALVMVGCTVEESDKNIDTATTNTKKAVDAAGEGAKAAAGATIEASANAAVGVNSAIDSVMAEGGVLDSALNGVNSAIESVKEVAN